MWRIALNLFIGDCEGLVLSTWCGIAGIGCLPCLVLALNGVGYLMNAVFESPLRICDSQRLSAVPAHSLPCIAAIHW